jgi:hypothetical protein
MVFIPGTSPPYTRQLFRCTVINSFVSAYHITTYVRCWGVAIFLLVAVTQYSGCSSNSNVTE